MLWLFTTASGHVVYWLLAGVASAFYGCYGWRIFHADEGRWAKMSAWRWHQIWRYSLASLAGWTAFWFLARDLLARWEWIPLSFSFSDFLLAAIAFLGMTGELARLAGPRS
jgi:hypothetical protein